MIQVDDIIKGDGCAIGRHAQFRRREHASRLVLPVAREESFFFLRADTAGKFAGDIAFQVEDAVIQKFFRYTDSRTQLVRPDGLLAESILAVRIESVLFHPGRFAMSRHDRNLAVAAGMDDRCQAAEEVLFLELVDELMLEFIRHQIAAIGICAHAQGVLYIDEVFMADAVPEGFSVSQRCTAFLFRGLVPSTGLFRDGRRCRLGQLGIELLLAFQAVDFLAQIHHIRFHLVIPGCIFCRYHAVLIAGRIQEGFRRIPEVLALLAQC